jgi:adenine-specific DNA-methyltransferase
MTKSNQLINESEFHPKTVLYLHQADLKHRKAYGQYFTPKSIIQILLKNLPDHQKNPKILDPACGTGEFLIAAQKYFKKPSLSGWDIDRSVTQIAREIVPKGQILTLNTLTHETKEKFDFIIGNPPYFELTPAKDIKIKYAPVINGRANIFSFFIKLGLDLLVDGGYLAYIVPPSMNNGAYFTKLRQYITSKSNIEKLIILDGSDLFHHALQSTMILILKKSLNTGNYLFRKNGIEIFTENPNHFQTLFQGKTTLHELGFTVKTGRLIWNENKDKLTTNPKNSIPLIWAHNITSNGLQLPLDKRPQYLKSGKPNIGPAIVVNRITGSIHSPSLKAAIIPKNMEFIAENHVNVIFPPHPDINLQPFVEELNSNKNLSILRYLTGNTQISKNELEKLFPVSKH